MDSSVREAPSTALQTFGSYIRSVRLRIGVESKEMAERIGVDPAHYVRVELGRKKPFSPERWAPFIAIGADLRVLHSLFLRHGADGAVRSRGKPSRVSRRQIAPGRPGSASWEDLSWNDDDWCWYAVQNHPDGLSNEEVSLLTGWTCTVVEEIEQSALAKLSVLSESCDAFDMLETLLQAHDEAAELARALDDEERKNQAQRSS
jgi:transcriptional regulator with XRE-family HTH domain